MRHLDGGKRAKVKEPQLHTSKRLLSQKLKISRLFHWRMSDALIRSVAKPLAIAGIALALPITLARLPFATAVGIILAGLLILAIIGGYLLGWDWIGVNERRYTKQENEEVRPGKTLWDWLQLLIIPAVLAGAALLFEQAQSTREQRIADERAQREQRIADERAQAEVLATYLDRMSELLLDKQLAQSAIGSSVREVARARTLTSLRLLGGERKGALLQFLYDSRLIGVSLAHRPEGESQPKVVSLIGADLNGASLSGARLVGADLIAVNLMGADLRDADLYDATLWAADLRGADLRGADLHDAIFRYADLRDADLRDADLHDATLWGADLRGADLRDTDLQDANLRYADLRDAKVTDDQLATASILSGATMPDGSQHK